MWIPSHHTHGYPTHSQGWNSVALSVKGHGHVLSVGCNLLQPLCPFSASSIKSLTLHFCQVAIKNFPGLRGYDKPVQYQGPPALPDPAQVCFKHTGSYCTVQHAFC